MKTISIIFTAILSLSDMTGSAQPVPSWNLTYEFPGGPKTGITIADTSCMVISLKNGVIRSFDFGISFEPVLHSGETHCIYTDTESRIYVGGKGRIYFSGDLGENWDSVALDTEMPVRQIIELEDSGMFAITGTLNDSLEYVGDGVFFSPDRGITWEKRNTGLGSFTVGERIATDRHGRVYLAVADEMMTGSGGLFVSENAGITWNHIRIRIDGRGVISDHPKVQFTHGLTVSDEDTILLSFEGSAGGYTSLNLRISVDDLNNGGRWDLYRANTGNTWYMDTPLQNQFFASDGTVFSSSTGVASVGKSYVKFPDEGTWKKFDAGLGRGEYGYRESQHFIEIDKKIFMVQHHDERIYQYDLESEIVSAPDGLTPGSALLLYPNPVLPGGKLCIAGDPADGMASLKIYSSSGTLISALDEFEFTNTISAPFQSGMYIVVAHRNNRSYRGTFIVQ